MARWVALGLGGLIAGWLIVAVGLWAVQDLLVFPGASIPRDPTLELRGRAEGWRIHIVPRENDPPLELWHHPAGGDRVLLMLHGNAGHPMQFAPHAALAAEEGWDVVAPVYRGFSGTPGVPSEEAVVEDALDAWAWARGALGVDARSLVVHGHSLGGGVAGQVAARVNPALVVFASTFDGLASMLARRHPYLPVRLSVRHPFDVVGALRDYRGAVLILHAEDDPAIPVSAARSLAAAHPEARLVVVPEGGHQPPVGVSPVAREAWIEALRAVAPTP